MIESPEMFRNVANQSLTQQVKLVPNAGNQKQGTPLRGITKKMVPSRPSSALSKQGGNQADLVANQMPTSKSSKRGQSL